MSGLHTDKLESFGKAMESLGKVGKVKISASTPKRISEIGNAMKSNLNNNNANNSNGVAPDCEKR